MLVKKICEGYVIQTFDTDTKQWVSQEFIASGEVEYEDENEEPIDAFDDDTYLPYNMEQPQ